MNKLTQAQFNQLTPEQQTMVATLEASCLREERRLRKQARHYRGQLWFSGLAMGALPLIYDFAPQKLSPFIIAMAILVLIQFHATGINRRLDAFMELAKNKTEEDEA